MLYLACVAIGLFYRMLTGRMTCSDSIRSTIEVPASSRVGAITCLHYAPGLERTGLPAMMVFHVQP